jgi:S-methylmethionine-dependent homocysteine/selenocysteine methylase
MMAQHLAASGVDLILCETFPHTQEARIAVEEAVATGLDTWVAFTAGPSGNLLTPVAMRQGAEVAIEAGAQAVLVNCVAASHTLPFVQALADLSVPVGAYANAGSDDGGWTWGADEAHPKPYLEHARQWVQAGAELIGSCCGTGPATIAALHGHLVAYPTSYRVSSHD